MKKILILSGSPRKNGNSDILCNEFMRGAIEKGIIYGMGAYEKGEIKGMNAMVEAYEMGKSIK